MTEVAPYEAPSVEVHESSLVSWARDAAEAYRVAQSLAKTSFVPAAMKGKPEEIAAAILTGAEMGLAPMSALRSLDIIQGTPALRANALRGLVQSAGHEVWVVESTETRAVVAGKRKGGEHEQRSTWTVDRASKLSLLSKDNWRKQPGAMLVARATAEVCRLIASDVLLGLPYAVEELGDPEPTEAPVAKARTAKRAALPAAPEPDSIRDPDPADDFTPDDPNDAAEPESMEET